VPSLGRTIPTAGGVKGRIFSYTSRGQEQVILPGKNILFQRVRSIVVSFTNRSIPGGSPEKPVSQRIASVAGGLAPNGDGPKKPRGEESRSACSDLAADCSPESPTDCGRAVSEVMPGAEPAGI
jgi:hypothetical protein